MRGFIVLVEPKLFIALNNGRFLAVDLLFTTYSPPFSIMRGFIVLVEPKLFIALNNGRFLAVDLLFTTYSPPSTSTLLPMIGIPPLACEGPLNNPPLAPITELLLPLI